MATKTKKHIGKNALKIVQEFFPTVTNVEDAEKDIEIEVTKTDSAVAQRYKHKECAFAVACKRKEKLDGVIIARSTAYLVKNNKATRFKLPISVQKEIISFDRGGGFEEGEYRLRKAYKFERLGVTGGHTEHRHTGKVEKRYRHLTMNIRSSLGS